MAQPIGTTSLWMATAAAPPAGSPAAVPAERRDESGLDRDAALAFAPYTFVQGAEDVDVCIVGAGIAGLTTALLLAREGRGVLVLDKAAPGRGETGRTTAHLSNAFDDWYHVLEEQRGEEMAALTAESHTAAIDLIERLVREEAIDCDFRRLDGYLFLAPGSKREELERELEAAHRAGLGAVEMLPALALPGGGTGPVLRFPRQGQFHPLKYVNGLVRAIRARGGIVAQARVAGVEGGEWATVSLDDGRSLRARAVVVATNSPILDTLSIHTKQAPYRTYALGLRLPRGSVEPALWWDTQEPYHYVRLESDPQRDHDVLVVGGEDHRTGEAHDMDQRFLRLEAFARRLWPMAGEVLYRWSGQVLEPSDGLALIGRNPGDTANVLLATGDSGMGMTHGTIAGMLLTDLLQQRENAWARLYDPSRSMTHGVLGWLKENLQTAREFARGHMGHGEDETVSEAGIRPGCGGIVAEGGEKLAVYRRDDGQVVRLSATCTHLGCTVHWNELENSWDCPCHGSRFAPEGQVLSGPAVGALKPAVDGGD
jgi:glycine/D-amino acid oxidase-like deaminating enzyme/nitrite reductase/ring-hydroxylating ferredoxin subunit